ncbi:MAG: SMC-Scp complex subunit ScpB [Gammaproteobacteria bacterium]|nr:SMC-Scp complex subunit ScpB [Pseudomonadales bacterium]MCP5345869.1 SMC-Scp complex subunit ScpB [Pseudomonadales bacterium]
MADVDNKIKMIVEGLLLAAGKPLSLAVIAGVFSEDERPDNDELRQVLATIAGECNDRGFELKEVASGYRFQVKQDISEWIARLWEEKPPRYSRALLETLALIAYRQPITRGDVEEIRGVAVSSNIMRTLVDREWVRVVGHKDVPGKPALYATTRQFLDYFNLKSIQELPPLSEIRELTRTREEFELDDELITGKVLDIPAEEPENTTEMIGEEGEVLVFEADELPDEDEAAALARKPLDEILGITEAEDTSGEFQEEVSESESESEARAAIDIPDDGDGDDRHDDSEPAAGIPAENGDEPGEPSLSTQQTEPGADAAESDREFDSPEQPETADAGESGSDQAGNDEQASPLPKQDEEEFEAGAADEADPDLEPAARTTAN